MSKKNIAIYARISKEQHPSQDDTSIANQLALARQWIERNVADADSSVEQYIDEGYTGTNFNRPAAKKLLAGIFLGRIQILVVKDLSRLSRNHLILSELLEIVFPKYSLRVIGIGEHYDSSRQQKTELAMAIQSVFYEYYARDISRKVKLSLQAKKEQGEYAVANLPYGYRKSDGGEWKIAPDEADVVQTIFSLSLQGYNVAEIAARLQDGQTVAVQENVSAHFFEPSVVWRILHNPVYTGQRVWHKYENSYENGFCTKSLPRGQWRQEEGCHPAIIPQELYDRVQLLHPVTAAYGKKKRKRHIFHGITRCGICGKALNRHRRQREILVCPENHTPGDVSLSMETLWKICFRIFGGGGKEPSGENEKECFLHTFVREIRIDGQEVCIFSEISMNKF
jgi:DNA invertase Pin-like site-specific DNA recombinase